MSFFSRFPSSADGTAFCFWTGTRNSFLCMRIVLVKALDIRTFCAGINEEANDSRVPEVANAIVSRREKLSGSPLLSAL